MSVKKDYVGFNPATQDLHNYPTTFNQIQNTRVSSQFKGFSFLVILLILFLLPFITRIISFGGSKEVYTFNTISDPVDNFSSFQTDTLNDFEAYRSSSFGKDYSMLSSVKVTIGTLFPNKTLISFSDVNKSWGDWGIMNWLRDALFNLVGLPIRIINLGAGVFTALVNIVTYVFAGEVVF